MLKCLLQRADSFIMIMERPPHLWVVRKPPKPPTTQIKLSVNLSSECVEAIRQMADKRKCSMTEVIRDAIGTEVFISNHEDDHKFLLETKDGTFRIVTFR